MFKKPVWDDFNFVTWSIILLEVASEYGYTVVIKRWTCSATIQERHPVWSSAAVAHLLQGLTCCAFRDGILHTLVVTSGYLSYCCLYIISNHSAHSPLTSDFNKAFSSTQLPDTGDFLFFWLFSVNHRDGCAWLFFYYYLLFVFKFF